MDTILIVGQDSQEIDNLAQTLESYGYSTISLDSTVDVVDSVLEDENIRLVIVEEKMPVYSGMETCRMLRNDPEISSELPVILLTRDSPRAQELEEAGVTDVIPYGADAHVIRESAVGYLEGYA